VRWRNEIEEECSLLGLCARARPAAYLCSRSLADWLAGCLASPLSIIRLYGGDRGAGGRRVVTAGDLLSFFRQSSWLTSVGRGAVRWHPDISPPAQFPLTPTFLQRRKFHSLNESNNELILFLMEKANGKGNYIAPQAAYCSCNGAVRHRQSRRTA